MTREKKTKFVILGFLLHDSLTGYEMGELIKRSTNNFWQESDASIYPTLKLLLKENLVSSSPDYVGKRRKEVFTITDEGRAVFLEWFKRTPDPDLHREEFLLKLFLTDDSTELAMQQHCVAKIRELQDRLQAYKEIETLLMNQLPKKKFWLKTLRIGMAHAKLEIDLLQQS